MKSVLIVFLWLPMTISALTLILILYVVSQPITSPGSQQVAGVYSVSADPIVIAADAPEPTPILPPFETSFIASDARPKIIERFLRDYACPFEPYDYYADKYVEIADAYNLDFRLLPAISMQESNCCKKIPEGSNNCWGYGIYGDQVVIFPSIENGIETVADTLSKKYSSKGLLEPDEIMAKYTPQSKGSWAAGVLHFMNEMK